MADWNSSPHPISDLREWYLNKRIIIQPDFQRRAVWNISAKIMLMDTILSNIPMPKIFLSTQIVDRATIRTVIDGQQRINAILEFLNDGFSLDAPYEGDYARMTFSQLPQEVQDGFLAYKIDYNEVKAISPAEIREIYSRVNKYSFPLNQQELRKADFPGRFLDLAEKECVHPFFDSIKLFSTASRRRLGDVEYISELLAAMLDGAQEKKETLNDFYMKGTKWDEQEYQKQLKDFESIIGEMKIINSKLRFSNSRFKQKSDFYALFLAISRLKKKNGTLQNKNIDYLIKDLKFLDAQIEPDSSCDILREYALKCISHANSKASREWRSQILEQILSGTFLNERPQNIHLFVTLKICQDELEYSAKSTKTCKRCKTAIASKSLQEEALLDWDKFTNEFQITNAHWIHSQCEG